MYLQVGGGWESGWKMFCLRWSNDLFEEEISLGGVGGRGGYNLAKGDWG